MKTSFKTITNIHRWRLTAITIGSALALTLANTAFAAPPPPTPTPTPSITSGDATGTVGVAFSYHITATNSPTSYGATGLPPGLTLETPPPSSKLGLIDGTPTTAGTYTVHLSATNGGGTGTKDVTFTIINPPPPHTFPTAIATSSPPAVYAGDTVTLDASASDTNPPGGTLTYVWQQIAPGSPNISLAPNNKAEIATFAAPAPLAGAESQLVTFKVKVTDKDAPTQQQNSESDPVTTTVYALPTANAGPDQNVDQSTVVMLHGSGTGAPPLTYTLTAPAGITFLDTRTSTSNSQTPTFTAPPFTPPNGTSYTFTLVVTEQRAGFPPKDSAPDQVVVMVKQPPIAYASFVNNINTITPEGTVSESSCTAFTNVTLYGFGVDPDLDTFTYAWTQVHDTGGTPFQTGVDTMATLDDNTSATPSFTAPDLPNGTQQIDLVYQLTVNDGTINSAPSYVTIHVLNTNDPPVAAATASPAPAHEGFTVTLDGSGSSDPNQNQGDTLTYTWTQVGGPGVTLSDVHAVMPTFTAPSVETTLSFVLTVTDHYGCSNQQGVDVTVIQNNHPPLAQAGSDQTVAEDKTACLDGSTSYDKDVGDTLTFHWDQIDGPTVVLDNPDSSQPCFATPNVGPAGATIHFHLTVTDNHGASSTDVSPPNYPTVAVNVTYVNQPP